MSFGKRLPLSHGTLIPQIGYGTWKSDPHDVEFGVECAIRNNYRHIDAAIIYENQEEIRAALKKVIPSVVKREDLFITSKLWNSAHRQEEVEKQLDLTLKQLGLDYLDLYLIHWPAAFVPGRVLEPPHPTKKGQLELDMETPLIDTWKAMVALPKSKVRAIGVSNFTVEYLKGIIDATGVVPAVLQIEAHPLLPQDHLVAFCKEKNIHITAYSPLGNNSIGKPKLTEHPTIKAIASSLGATEAQVLIAWGVYRGYSVIPKSVHEDRIISNFKQIKLSKEDYEKVCEIGKGNYTRFNIPYRYKPNWDINQFGEPEEQEATFKVKLR